MINEEWRDIQGYEGVYQVNPIGQVKRIGGGSGAVRGLVLKDFDNGHAAIGIFHSPKMVKAAITTYTSYSPPLLFLTLNVSRK